MSSITKKTPTYKIKPKPIKNNIIDYINEVLNETVEDDEKQNLPEDWEEGAYHSQIPFFSKFYSFI